MVIHEFNDTEKVTKNINTRFFRCSLTTAIQVEDFENVSNV